MGDSLLTQAEIDALLPKLQDSAQELQSNEPAKHDGVQTRYDAAAGGPSSPSPKQLQRILDIPLSIRVGLGETQKTLSEVLSFIPGSIVEFERSVSNPVDIMLNDKLIARGEVVIVDEHFGVRITQIIGPKDRLQAVQKGT